MTITAPDHLKGPMKPWSDLRAERDAWAAQMAFAGHSSPQIGKALGIDQKTALRAANRGGWTHQAKPPSVKAVMEKMGVTLGSVGPVFDALDDKTQDALINAAMQQNVTIAQVLAKTFVEARQ